MSVPILHIFGPLIPSQEIVLRTKNGLVIRIDFDKRATGFNPSGTVFHPAAGFSGLDLRAYNGAEPQFEQIVKTASAALAQHGDPIVELDNPCNDEFVKIDRQVACVSALATPFVVKLNGKAKYTPHN